MTNLEFYKFELLKIGEKRKLVAIVKGKATTCISVECKDCDLYNNCTAARLIKWLLSEHIEETENCKICKNLKVDDKILVSNTGDYWGKRYFAEYDPENDVVVAFDSGTTSWSANNVSHWKYVKLPEEESEQNG